MSLMTALSKRLTSSKRDRGGRRFPYGAIAVALQVALAALGIGAFTACAQAEPLRIVALGDSLTAGLGLPADKAPPAVLEQRLRADGYDAVVVNAGISGDRTEGGLARIDYALEDGADLVILELGANDMLTGVDTETTKKNLEKMIAISNRKGARVLLVGIEANGNFGKAYKRAFDTIHPALAKQHALPYCPSILENVAGNPALTLSDLLHPNAVGVEYIVARLAPIVEKTLYEIQAARDGSRATR
jgi:acyl-CoA thioesterase I